MAHDLELLLVALGHPFDHVGRQRAGQAVDRPRGAAVAVPGDDDLAGRLVDGHLHRRMQRLLEFAERTFHQECATAHGSFHALGKRNWIFADTGHAA
jgi:hypothetical protein